MRQHVLLIALLMLIVSVPSVVLIKIQDYCDSTKQTLIYNVKLITPNGEIYKELSFKTKQPPLLKYHWSGCTLTVQDGKDYDVGIGWLIEYEEVQFNEQIN